jgi:hypothetical protein
MRELSQWKRWAAIMVAALALVLGACGDDDDDEGGGDTGAADTGQADTGGGDDTSMDDTTMDDTSMDEPDVVELTCAEAQTAGNTGACVNDDDCPLVDSETAPTVQDLATLCTLCCEELAAVAGEDCTPIEAAVVLDADDCADTDSCVCIENCTAGVTGVSAGCAECYGSIAACGALNCAGPCALGIGCGTDAFPDCDNDCDCACDACLEQCAVDTDFENCRGF